MIGRAYRLAQLLSLDIVIGAVLLLRFFCAQFEISAEWEIYFLLGATVWLIYTADHLRDAERSKDSTRERYVFHRKNRKILILISVIVIILCGSLIFFIPVIIFLGGLTLSIFSFSYLLIQHKLSSLFSKELYVSLVYSLGIFMVPTLLSSTVNWMLLILLFLLTFVNLLVFSWYEKEEDERDGFASIATQMATGKLDKLIFALLAIGLGLAFLSFGNAHIYFILSFSIHASMILFPNKFRKNQRYRAIGDGVFLLPILF